MIQKLHYDWHVVGHQKELLALERDLLKDNLAHAYLFSGPENIGKYTVAKRFAEILQCENGGCGACSTCLEIRRDYNADTLEIVGTDESVKIDTVREILASLYTKPQSRHKILLIKNIEKMTAEAANALLKTLEEPPPQMIFLLTTSHLHDVLLTVVSRVRLCKFYLKDAGLLERHADLMQQIEGFLANPDPFQRFSFIEDIIVKKKGATNDRDSSLPNPYLIKDFLDALVHVLRTQMYAEIQHADFKKATKTVQSIRYVEDAHSMLKRNVNSRLVLENLMLSL